MKFRVGDTVVVSPDEDDDFEPYTGTVLLVRQGITSVLYTVTDPEDVVGERDAYEGQLKGVPDAADR